MADFLTLKKANCKNCYKCIRNCPVKAIRFNANQAHIMGNDCILCGRCFVVCPQNAKSVMVETEKVQMLIQSGDPVVVSLAPSFIANYPGVGFRAMKKALHQLGFSDVEETAIGATIVKTEYERILREENRDVLISSSCHSVNLLIQKHFPAAINYLADVMSPMQVHCMQIKRKNPEAKTVFIGPCVAKKDEAAHYAGIVDAVMTFEELSAWMREEGITLSPEMDQAEESRARLFPIPGGILKTMDQQIGGYHFVAVNGVENCKAALQDIIDGKIHHCFIEMSACVDSCIGGPLMEKHQHTSNLMGVLAVTRYAGSLDFAADQPEPSDLRKNYQLIGRTPLMPTELQIRNILRQMGKTSPAQELNCGTCGYNTCREKAIAVWQGKAEISMCLPFLKDKAENFSDTIVKNTPNGLIVLNEDLEVQQINDAAMRIMNIRSAGDVLGDHVVRILDPLVFLEALDGTKVRDRRSYLAEYKRYVDQTVVYDEESHLLIGILRDVTQEEKDREKKERISRQTVEVADKVVEKQMRIVQEIASLLGETAAETKIALTKLKESIHDE